MGWSVASTAIVAMLMVVSQQVATAAATRGGQVSIAVIIREA